ncbi:MAG: hypothetical protein DCF27_04155 [Lysobacteraceae bacterium]|nr:MAG: hypothetical protein DCF27_04155 [Xanthomonadaceae bacterium]
MVFAQAVDDVGGYAKPGASTKLPAADSLHRSGSFTMDILGGVGFFDGSEGVTNTGRIFRGGVPGAVCAPFNLGDNYQFRTIPFVTDSSGSMTATVANGTCGSGIFVSFHTTAFNPASVCDNHVWDSGSSADYTDTFAVPPNTPMVMAVTGTNILAPGLACGPFTFDLDGVGSLGVTLTIPGSNTPVPVAEELIVPPARLLANPSNRLSINTDIGYAFSPGEVRYARLNCPGAQFTTASVIDFTGNASNTIGAVNGLGSDAIFFSITAGATPVVATDGFTVNGTRTVTSKAPVDCSYGLYDFPSQAQAGGATGRVAATSGAYLRFNPSYALEVNAQGSAVADVESNDPAYSEFVLGSPTFNVNRAQLGQFSYGTVQAVLGDTQPITLDGLAIELTDLMGANTALNFAGDFDAAGDVFFSPNANCAVNIQSANTFDATQATFVIGAAPKLNHYLCFDAGGDPIRASNYTVALAPVSAAAAVYAVTPRGPLALGAITRNGAELQAPLAQVPAGYLSRMVLTNTGSVAREYVIEVLGETGNVISTANLTGSVAAGKTLVVDLKTVLTGFTAAPRATLNVTVSGPNKQIQGLYQIVNPNSGTVSNHVMVRPGTN